MKNIFDTALKGQYEQKNVNAEKLIQTLIPKLIKVSVNGLQVIFPSEYAPLLCEGESLNQEVAELIVARFKVVKDLGTNLREQHSLLSTPILVSFFPQENTVRLSSARLARELILLQDLSKEKNTDLITKLTSEEFQTFREHVELISKLDSEKFPTVHQITHSYYELKDTEDTNEFAVVHQRAQEIIDDLLKKIKEYKPSLFERFSDYGLGLTANYALLRVHLLKFLAILPSLDHDKKGVEVKRLLIESLTRLLVDSKKAKRLKYKGDRRALEKGLTLLIGIGLQIVQIFPAEILAKLVRTAVRFMARRFIAGESISDAKTSLSALAASGREATLDQLGELVVSEKEADNYQNEVLNIINGLAEHIQKGDKNSAGILKAHVSIKVSALCSDFKPESFDETYSLVAPRLIKILKTAKDEQVFINIDAEHYHYRDIVFKIYRKVLLETPELKDYDQTGIVLQSYLRDSTHHLDEIIELARERGHTMPVRIVKGAYWDAETVEADAHSFVAPEFLNKEETDLNYRSMVYRLMDSYPALQLCLASHNFSDHAFAEALREKKFPNTPEIEHQCLHMTYEALSTAMAAKKWCVRNYVPVGSLLVGMAYLVRRIMENSSQVGVLTIMRSHNKNRRLESPKVIHENKIKKGEIVRDKTQAHLTAGYFNVAPVKTFLDKERLPLENALKNFQANGLGLAYEHRFKLSGEKVTITSSSDTSIKVGEITFATVEDTKKAIEAVETSYKKGDWAKSNPIVRANILLRTADLMLAKRSDLSCLISYEAGKTMKEALGDVDEAIDFLNFYAREELRLHELDPKSIGLGPTAVVAPWNFPLAIPCGMVASALVAGNSVILKSAEQTPLIASVLVELFHCAGVPEDVLIHLPGEGETVGQALIENPAIAMIVFTGSKNVGIHIARVAAKRFYTNPHTGVTYPVKVITEMGGKNAIIVTANAELDETVSGILASAYGHGGQKCSACSRVIVDNRVKDRLVERLRDASGDIKVGKAWDFSTAINPLITANDKERLKQQISEAGREARENNGQVVIDRSAEDLPGHAIGPAVFVLPKDRAKSEESFAMQELFGPVIHVIGYDSKEEAIDIFNSPDYALTGGVFSQSQDDLDWYTSRMESGNIYVNRTITGARVGIEPFGGFKLSGTGPKAGGKEYLASFHTTANFLMGIPESKEEDGSEYRFDMRRASRLKLSTRLERLEKLTGELHRKFESLYPGQFGDFKDILGRFKKWTHEEYEAFFTEGHQNTKIPGQISYNDYSQTKKSLLVIGLLERPEYQTLLSVLCALAAGTGVTVLCRDQKSYAWWADFNSIAYSCGFSKDNLDAYFVTKNLLEETVANANYEVLLVDSSAKRAQEIVEIALKDFARNGHKSKHMRAVLTSMNTPHRLDFKSMARQFINVRSFAINIMRHGAPLEINE